MDEQVWGRGTGDRGLQTPLPTFGERAVCGNIACAGGWMGFWKDHRRPMFEGHWGCSSMCLQAMVEAALRRQADDVDGAESRGAHRHRVPLGLILLQQGWITKVQLERALYCQRSAGTGLIGRWLTEECGLDPDYVTRGLGLQWSCPVLRADDFEAPAMALLAPAGWLQSTGMVPLRLAAGRILYVAFTSAVDAAAAFAMERISGMQVVSGLMEETRWDAARLRLCACKAVEAEFGHVPQEMLAGEIAEVLCRMRPRAARLVRVRQMYWLRMWLELETMLDRARGIPRNPENVADRIYTVYQQR